VYVCVQSCYDKKAHRLFKVGRVVQGLRHGGDNKAAWVARCDSTRTYDAQVVCDGSQIVPLTRGVPLDVRAHVVFRLHSGHHSRRKGRERGRPQATRVQYRGGFSGQRGIVQRVEASEILEL
jgi:hypothetical protein